MLYNTTPDQLYEPHAAVDPLGYGRVAIVTGCASGIGLACTQLLLAHQFSVCGLDRRPFDYAKLLRTADHGRFHFHQCDLTEPGACDDAVRICRNSFGGGISGSRTTTSAGSSLDAHIDVLVNVAGLMDGFASADTITDAVWDEVLAINLTVPVRMMRAVLSSMVASSPASSSSASPGGAIVNVASTAGLSGAVAGIAYTASKHGLIGATKNVAWRFHHEGIRCNAVLPGAVDSSIGQAIAGRVDGGLDSAGFAQLAPVHALQARPTAMADAGNTTDITALDVAKAIVFLVSDQARSINGVCLPVDKAWGVM